MRKASHVVKLLLALLLVGLAALEFVHHFADGRELTVKSALNCADPKVAAQEAKALLWQHLQSHRQ